ncbi:MAG: capsular biosynthesis protein [Mesorhizobium sp.]|nr:CpsB/CapC family capsule biosynthesis tyrosine phosphatase [Mesorhizobium sp.]TIP05731.1 MAG: capsular biosynthesis protein [Mesorhizobium sp.]
MIDLHSHILFGLDDGAPDMATSLEMARMAVADGITHMACTPHVVPGSYPNSSATILPAMQALQAMLDAQQIPLKLYCGADVHIAPNLVERLANGDIPTLNGSRYLLLEPLHEVLSPKLEDLAARLLEAGFVPIITHPERLLWAERHFDVIRRLADVGCPLQITAGAVVGGFGLPARRLAEKILKEGRASVVASDAHGATWRRPVMSKAYRAVADQAGEDEAERLFRSRPAAILADAEPGLVMPARRAGMRPQSGHGAARRFIDRMFGNG